CDDGKDTGYHPEYHTITAEGPIDDGVTVEDLMYTYKSDKSRDDHGYTKLYDMIFSPIRGSVKNITEVGIAAGQSLQAWYRYFPHAEIHAFDVLETPAPVQENLDRMPRVHPHIVNLLDAGNDPVALGFVPESMDIIIEDGPHTSRSQQQFLTTLFPLLKPGGYYVIEDVGSGQGGPRAFHEKPEEQSAEVRAILESNDAIWVDASLGHRAWDEWIKRVGGMWAKDRIYHNSYVVVIKKREKPLREVLMHYKAGAMSPNHIVKENITAEVRTGGNATARF
ncbi:hypothetical protein ACHAWF_000877, partial [Thalassiosira exigua]